MEMKLTHKKYFCPICNNQVLPPDSPSVAIMNKFVEDIVIKYPHWPRCHLHLDQVLYFEPGMITIIKDIDVLEQFIKEVAPDLFKYWQDFQSNEFQSDS